MAGSKNVKTVPFQVEQPMVLPAVEHEKESSGNTGNSRRENDKALVLASQEVKVHEKHNA